MNPVLEPILAELIGKTIERITSAALRTDGSGPCLVVITFTDGTCVHFDIEELTLLLMDSGIRHWYSQDRFKIHQQVRRDSR